MTRNTKMEGARLMLADLHDEATALAVAVEEALAYDAQRPDDPAPALVLLGSMDVLDRHIEAMRVAYTAAKALLMRARDGGR
jgi:hypothetical protein